jgi:tetratricopeptide (TPR) repeat protein
LTFEADDDEVDALLSGPILDPPTRDFERGERSEQSSGIDIQVPEIDPRDSEPTRSIDASSLVPGNDDEGAEAQAPMSSLPPTRKIDADSSRPSTLRWSEKPTQRHAVVAPAGALHNIPEPIEATLRERADWLGEEAAARSGVEQARLLLALSEIRAILGERASAAELAVRARTAAPQLLLAHKQARALSVATVVELANGLTDEANAAVAPEARLHALLMAADVLRTNGDEATALRMWTELASASPDDPRALMARAASGLARGEIEAVAKLAALPGPQPIRDAIVAALALRGSLPEGLPSSEALTAVRPNDALRRARAAFSANDVVTAATCLAELSELPELSRPAGWLFGAIGRTQPETRRAAAAALEELVTQGEEQACRPLAAIAIELSDARLAEIAIQSGAFSTADRAVIRTLLDVDVASRESDSDALSIAGALGPLAAAIAAHLPPRSATAEGDVDAQLRWIEGRAHRACGSAVSRAEWRVARLLSAQAPAETTLSALDSPEEATLPEASGIALELDARLGRWTQIAQTLASLQPNPGYGHDGDSLLAAGLVFERTGELERARDSYRAALAKDPTNEGTARALADLDPATDLSDQLSDLANPIGESVVSALLCLEAFMRADGAATAKRTALLERAHRAAPELPMAALLARAMARKAGDLGELSRWSREGHATDADPMEHAVRAVRQAMVLEKTDPTAASAYAAEAHRARPDDLALREYYERLSQEPLPDQGAWREKRAGRAKGHARLMLYMEATHRYELQGDTSAALRSAEAAVSSGDSTLARLALERAEIEAGATSRLADVLLVRAREAETVEERREAYERLADLDAVGRGDSTSALLWHRSILEECPTYKPSLRHLEHAFIGDGREEELEPVMTSVARALDGATGHECGAHADFAARLRSRGSAGSWDSTGEVAELGASQPAPSLSSQRLLNAHARSRQDDALTLKTTLAILSRATRASERAALLLRAGEAASSLDDLALATELFERAKSEDPADLVAWERLASARRRAGDPRGAAEGYEGLAGTCLVPEHRVSAWYDAAVSWLDQVHDEDRGRAALEQAAAIDLIYKDVFPRLLAIYAARGAKGDLAALLERRIAHVADAEERVTLEVLRGRTLAEVGDNAGARRALESALESQPDSIPALAEYAELSSSEKDWAAAEQAWVRLARLLSSAEEQRAVYGRLGQLYANHAVNLARAELAFKEVLRRAPGDVATLELLVDIYRRQDDATHAIETAHTLVLLARDPSEKRARLVELSALYESPGNDVRKAEQTLEGARREFPTDVTILRALAEFYIRHQQMPAVHILLDRAAADARRAFAAGRFSPALFEVMRAVFELRGRKDAARIVGATLAAFDGQPANVRGADARALDPELDEKLAPEVLTPALRTLLRSAGSALDAAAPVDLRALQATLLPPSHASLQKTINALATAAGLPPPVVHVSAPLGLACIPAGSEPPTLVIGEALLLAQDDLASRFLIVRAVKLIAAHASALVRTPSSDLGVLVSAWLQAFNPTWTPQGVNPTTLAEALKKISSAIPKRLPPEIGMLALEVAGALGLRASTLGAMALSWADRAALLSIGDPNAALRAIAWAHGARDGAPAHPEQRAQWLARTHEAKDLMTFSISDAYAEARDRLGLDT